MVEGKEEVPGDEVVLDFSAVKPFEPLEENQWYLCGVSSFELGRAKPERGGGPKASLVLAVKEPEAYVNRKLFREYSLQPQALPFLYQLIRAIDPTAVLDEKFVFNPHKYIGMECAVRVRNEEFEEQIRSRVGTIAPASRYSA